MHEMRPHALQINWKRCFFYSAGVIEAKCSRFPRARMRQRHSLMTRRAVWRRSERRRPKRQQKRARRKQSAVRRSRQPLLNGRRRLTLLTASNGPAVLSSDNHRSATPRPCRRQRASARQRVGQNCLLTVLVIGPVLGQVWTDGEQRVRSGKLPLPSDGRFTCFGPWPRHLADALSHF